MICENCNNPHNGSYGSGRFCSVKCARGFSTKIKRAHISSKVSRTLKGRKLSCTQKDKISCNNGSKSDKTKREISSSLKQFYKENPDLMSQRMTGKKMSDDFKKKMSKIAISRGLGGVRASKRIQYKGKSLGSSYELELVKSLDHNCIKWDTCKRLKYTDRSGKVRTYRPDIYLIDYDIYLDPKNDFLIENINPSLGFKDLDKIKWVEQQNNVKIFVLNKNQLNWEYVASLVK